MTPGMLVSTSTAERAYEIESIHQNTEMYICNDEVGVMDYFDTVDFNFIKHNETQKYAEYEYAKFNNFEITMEQDYTLFNQMACEEEFMLVHAHESSRITKGIEHIPDLKKISQVPSGPQLEGITVKREQTESSEDATAIKIEQLKSRLTMYEQIIKQVGEEEMDFEDNENSSYIMYTRYMQIANQIHEEICQLQGSDPKDDITFFSRLDFGKSYFEKFNNVLSNEFRVRNEATFPTFYDVNKCLRKCAQENNICQGESELEVEIARCFQELAKLLKTRRGIDMDYILSAYLPNLKDPAMMDPELDCKIRKNLEIAKKREYQIINLYVLKQNAGEELQLTDDSDSNDSDSCWSDESSGDESEDMQ